MTALDPQTTATTAPHGSEGGTSSRVHVPPGEGRHDVMIDGDHVRKTAVRDAEGAFEVFEVVAPARPMGPPHVSPWTAVVYVLEGRVTFRIGDRTYDVGPGGLAVAEAGTPVTFEVHGETARLLAITSGDRAGRFFADFAASVPAERPVEESLEAILSVTARHGVRLAVG